MRYFWTAELLIFSWAVPTKHTGSTATLYVQMKILQQEHTVALSFAQSKYARNSTNAAGIPERGVF